MIDYTTKPYASWLEEANKALVEIDPDGIYFGLIKDGEVVSSYWNINQSERIMLLQELIELGVLDFLESNREMIWEILKGNLDEQNEEDEDENEGEYE